MTTDEIVEALAKAHAYYCTHAHVEQTDRLIVRYLLEHEDQLRRRAALTDREETL